MPSEAKADEDTSIAKVCRRCGAADPQNLVRQELLCSDCLERYVKTKVVKRVEAFRGRNADPRSPRRWLLPLSGGSSSTSLLHVLHDNLQRQINRSGRTSFELHCVHISGLEQSESAVDLFDEKKTQYPTYSYAVFPLMTQNEANDALKTSVLSKVSDLPPKSNGNSTNHDAPLLSLRSDLSPSSKADLVNILKHKTLIRAATALNCEGILMGDTTTRLAERVLAETSKGRGISLPSLVNDYKSPHGIWIFYPMKDVLKKEVLQFSRSLNLSTLDSSDGSGSSNSQTVIRNSSIDTLMTGYFQSVEENYPSVVANVVKTSGKLQNASTGSYEKFCSLCEMPFEDGDPGLNSHGLGSANSTNGVQSAYQYTLCFGCDKLVTAS